MKIAIKKFAFQSEKIFESLSKEEKILIATKSESFVFKKGKLIFYEEGIPTGVFFIEKGRAKIFKTGLDAKEQIFYIYKKGDILGYHALLCNEKYEDSCQALEDCEISFISKANFNDLLIKIPKLKTQLIQNMAHEFGVLVNIITVLAQKPLRERLALYLLILEERYQELPNQKTEIKLAREDLANIIGTSRESLGRLLREFKDDGLILIDKRNIELVNRKKIEQIAYWQ